jgi:tetratricopeptide (TPR) repeat protein
VEGRILGNLGALHHDRRRFDQASAFYRDALAILQEIGDQRLESIHVSNLGILEQERGELARARTHYDAALDLLARLGDRRLEAIVLGNLGTLEHEEGRLPAARHAHERALQILREAGDGRSETLCLGRLCRANAALGWVEDARSCVAAAERWLGRWPDPLVGQTIALDRAFLEVAEARAALGSGDASTAGGKLASARARLEAVRTPTGDDPAWIDRSDDIRAGVRLLEAELATAAAGSEPVAARRGTALAIGPEGAWLQLPGEEAQDLRRRKALRLILLRLVEEHEKNPGAGVSLELLLSAGWPGERVVASAGANRVYVALTALRKLGLRKLLLSQDDGYLLDPALPVEHVRGEAAPV